MKKILFISLTLFFSSVAFASAALPTNQPLQTLGSQSHGSPQQQPLGATSTWSGTINSIGYYLGSTTSTSDYFWVARICADNEDPFGSTFCGTSGSFATATIEKTNAFGKYKIFNLNTPFIIPATGTIKWSGCAMTPAAGSSTGWNCAEGNGFPTGATSTNYYDSARPTNWPEYPVYWNLNFNADSAITLTNPEDLETLPDFTNWQTSFSNLIVGNQYAVKILYGTDQNNLVLQDQTGGFSATTQNGTMNVYKNNSLLPFSGTSTITYYAQPLLYDYSLGLIRYGTVISFSVSNNIIATSTPPWNASSTWLNLNSTSSPFYVDCSQTGGGSFFSSSTIDALACYAQKTIFAGVGFLVVPPAIFQDYMNDSILSMKNAFPFSLVYGISQSVQSSINTSSTVNMANLNLNLPGVGTSTVLAELDLENWVGAEKKESIFTVLEYVIWAGLLFKIIILVL